MPRKNEPGDPSWLLNRNGRWYVQVRVPQNLVPLIGRTHIKRALRTSDKAEAKRRLRQEAAEIERQFEQARQKLKTQAKQIAPHLGNYEIDRYVLGWFRQAERASIEDAFREPELNHLALQDSYEELAILLGDEEKHAWYVQQTADRVLLDAGFPSKPAPERPGPIQSTIKRRVPDIDKMNAEYQNLCKRIRRGMIENVRRQQQRYKGQSTITIDPEFAPESIEKFSGPPISQILEVRIKEEKPSNKTEQEWRRTVQWFIELNEDLPIDAITKAHVRRYKDALLKKPKVLSAKLRALTLPEIIEYAEGKSLPMGSSGGAQKPLSLFKALLSWSMSNGYIENNPSAGLSIKRTDKSRIAFDKEELQKIFTDIRRFRESEPDKFWITLLAFTTGARESELIQLNVKDIRERDGIFVISINDEDSKMIKNKSSIREVPIHTDVIKCGFLDYVEERRATGIKELFPIMNNHKHRLSEKFCKWFGGYKRTLGITDNRKVFHSFRHGFKTLCRDAGVPEEIHDALTGHSNGSVGRGYGSIGLATKAEAVGKIDFGISLDHLYPRKSGRAINLG